MENNTIKINEKQRISIMKIRGFYSDRKGMTMAEMLVVVAIIVILAGVAFIAVINHQRSLAQLERDNIAKEIFIAAQNHLTPIKGEGYPGLRIKNASTGDYKYSETGFGSQEEGDKEVFEIVVNGGEEITDNATDIDTDSVTLFKLMLPFGSIDETVRGGGNYIIRYDRESGVVIEVFYCTAEGTRFGHAMSAYSQVKDMGGENNKSIRRNWNGDGGILGWYGGGDAAGLPRTRFEEPVIKVDNSEVLAVKIVDPNTAKVGEELSLLVTGETSGAKQYFKLVKSGDDESPASNNISYESAKNTYTVILDDITTPNTHFADLLYTDDSNTIARAASNKTKFIPGENITVQAVAYSTSALANIEFSKAAKTNGLFRGINNTDDTIVVAGNKINNTAYIDNIRHLENLDIDVSSLETNKPINSTISISIAKQTNDLDWDVFLNNVKEKRISDDDQVSIYNKQGIAVTNGYRYLPVNQKNGFVYDGEKHSIKNVVAGTDINGDSGIFGTLKGGTVSNIDIVNIKAVGTRNAGALAGFVNGADIENVLARANNLSAENYDNTFITSTDTAGGLIGLMSTLNGDPNDESVIRYCAAAIKVNSDNAGGLIGASSGGTIEKCYSGGHTDRGEFYMHENNGQYVYVNGERQPIYNITGTDLAGGLIGSSSGTTITNSYSTCSVSGATAGGFVGYASGTINNSYCTGLVSGDLIVNKTKNSEERNGDNAFVGDYRNLTVSDSYYFSIINEVKIEESNTFEYKKPGVSGVSEIDSEMKKGRSTYESFVSSRDTWASANAYDKDLRKYYGLKYNLRTVMQLPASTTKASATDTDEEFFVNTHYGDWPAPEIFFINQ